jgi:hypothetical protein
MRARKPTERFEFWVDFFFGVIFGFLLGLLAASRMLMRGHSIAALFVIAGVTLLVGGLAAHAEGGISDFISRR